MTDRPGYPIILCGDHAEFEREHANTPPYERPDWPLPSFDARDWAAAFCKRNPQIDEGLMLAWFASALMRGFDEHAARTTVELQKAIDDAPKQIAEAVVAEIGPEITRLRAENENLRRWKALDKPLTAAMEIANLAIDQRRAENDCLRAELAQVREILGERENTITRLRAQRDRLLAALLECRDAFGWHPANPLLARVNAAIDAVEEKP